MNKFRTFGFDFTGLEIRESSKLKEFYFSALEKKDYKAIMNHPRFFMEIENPKQQQPQLIQEGGDIYEAIGGESRGFVDGEMLSMEGFIQLKPLPSYYPGAVKCLRKVVLDENLSLGSKKRIRDIAIESFRGRVKKALDPAYATYEYGWGIKDCQLTHLDPWAINTLNDWGFKVMDAQTELKNSVIQMQKEFKLMEIRERVRKKSNKK